MGGEQDELLAYEHNLIFYQLLCYRELFGKPPDYKLFSRMAPMALSLELAKCLCIKQPLEQRGYGQDLEYQEIIKESEEEVGCSLPEIDFEQSGREKCLADVRRCIRLCLPYEIVTDNGSDSSALLQLSFHCRRYGIDRNALLGMPDWKKRLDRARKEEKSLLQVTE